MEEKTVNITWIRHAIGIILVVQVIPFLWGFASADHWGEKKGSYVDKFDWSLFWPSYWGVYTTIYGWILGIAAFIAIIVWCFAKRTET